ncbi:MAG: uracil-DNA glycosylase [Betaproteobacteria bacterium]|nr:uracil-DNA glycosylase [Betaproteobacteria bacterium]MBU6513340.1 uracil-DNA glycosylase [Betaproteobacteria bacterium]MDE1956161.1 uracil-DNA glycosylase [Betaproteobacteria bacterium]MDE2151787.1 uracil-DNA glycosylase [Betaproteobacteria bacterium]
MVHHKQSTRERAGAPTGHPVYDPHCRRCSRLAGFRDEVHERHPQYACLPVPSFGPLTASLLVVGLAPGLHGANATNRPFTGDGAGPLLYGTLNELGLATREPPVLAGDPPASIRADDGMRMLDCRICNSVKCLPPGNKPLPAEVRECNAYLRAELASMPRLAVVLALGTVAHGAVLQALGLKASAARFAHGARHELGGLRLYDSYHCSRYNQNTGRLTAGMFRDVFERAAADARAAGA